jgi:putative ABC transport system permease protein
MRRALRSLRRTPWFTLTASGVIALGIALSTTVFAIVDGVLFKPLPYPRASELYLVSGGYQKGQSGGIVVAPRNLRDWADAVPDVGMTAFMAGSGGAGSRDIRGWVPVGAYVDQHFFDVIAVHPMIGGFQPDDFGSGSTESPAIISYSIWQSMFGGRPDVIGQLLPTATRGTHRVVGVLPPDFLFPVPGRFQPDLLQPWVTPPDKKDDLRFRRVYGIARLPSTKPLSEYQSRMDAAAAAEAADWVPRPNDGSPVFDRVGLMPIEAHLTGTQRPVFSIAFGTAFALWLLAAVSISGLMAARVQDRAGEFATRRAVGASGVQIAKLLFTESCTLAVVGGATGLFIAKPLAAVTLRLLPDSSGLMKSSLVDWRVAGFAALASAGAGLLVSLLPAWRAARVSTPGAIAATGTTTGRGWPIARFAIVAVQIALGLTLTVGGTYLVGSLLRLWRTDIGFQSSGLIILNGSVARRSVTDRAQAISGLSRELARISGVTAVGATESSLLGGGMLMNAFTGGANYAVTPGLFEALGLRLVSGRWLTTAEMDQGAPVVVISEKIAARIAPGQSAIGRQIKGYVDQQPQPFTVVGVTAEARLIRWDYERSGQLFAPYRAIADDQPGVTVLVRTTGAVDLMSQFVRQFRDSSGDVRITQIGTANDLLADSVRERRLESWVFGSFAAAALTIVSLGILGLMAMTAARRTREVGIRVALGATRTTLVSQMLREQLSPIVIGLVGGGILAAWAITFVKKSLYQLTVNDPRVWAIAVGLILLAATTGAIVPSIRASRIDPVQSLRRD